MLEHHTRLSTAVAALAWLAPSVCAAAELPTADGILALLREPPIATALALGIGIGAVIAVLLRRRPPAPQAAAPAETSTPNRPLGQWTGLCHALCVRTGARLVCIHISDEGDESTLRAAWQLNDKVQPNLNFSLPAPTHEIRVYNADRAPLPSVTQIAASGAVAGLSVPILSPSNQPVGWLSAFFDYAEVDPDGQAAASETAALIGALHHLAT
ncbi:MAG: hypothetical protein AAF499_16200, partial [Pseudomonadota bacterium]